MSDYQAILDEEFEVLESIFPDELEKTSDREVRIRIEPDEGSSSHPLILNLIVKYPPTYPDVIPDLSLDDIDEESGELTEEEDESVLQQLRTVAEESLGMAMTFTIASSAREALSGVVAARIKRESDEEERRAREYEEAEAKKTRGTPVTLDTFTSWRKGFSAELKEKREREEDERIKALTGREKEDYKKRRERPSGKQLFETSKTLATSDEALYEEGAAEVDMSQYTREERDQERRREEEEEERRRQGLVAVDEDESDSD